MTLPTLSATEILAHQLVDLERRAVQAELNLRDGEAARLWRLRDDVRHQRSLLLRQLWRYESSSCRSRV